MRSITALNPVTGVIAGATATLNLDVGQTYDRIHFQYTGVTPEQIKNVRVELGTKTITEYETLQALIDENNYYQREKTTGFTTLHFVRTELAGVQALPLIEQRFFALGTAGVSSARIRFDIDAAATAPVISAFAEKSLGVAPGWLFRRKKYGYGLLGGETEIADIPKPPDAHIAAIHIKATGVTGAEFSLDNTKWREYIPKDLHNLVLKQNKRTPIADTFTIDFTLMGDMYDSVKLHQAIQSMRLKIQAAAATNAEIIVEYFDNFAGSKL